MTDTKRTRAELKSFFETSDIPTQSEFDDLITTMATQLGSNVFSEDTQTFQGSVAVLSGVSAAYFYGDGTFLTNITADAEWNGSRIGDANITGELTVGTSISSPNISADYFYGDGQSLYRLPLVYNLGFNSIPDFIIPGDSIWRNLGGSGYRVDIPLNTSYGKRAVYSEDDTLYTFKILLILSEQYGGTNDIQARLNVVVGNNTGASGITTGTIEGTPVRYIHFGQNNSIDYISFDFRCVKQINGVDTDFLKLEVEAIRTAFGGNTSFVNGQLIFNY